MKVAFIFKDEILAEAEISVSEQTAADIDDLIKEAFEELSKKFEVSIGVLEDLKHYMEFSPVEPVVDELERLRGQTED